MGDPTICARRLTSEPTRFHLSGHQSLVNTGSFATSTDVEEPLFDEHGLCPFHCRPRKPAHFDNLADGDRVFVLAETPRFAHHAAVDDELRRGEVAEPVVHDGVRDRGETEGNTALGPLHLSNLERK